VSGSAFALEAAFAAATNANRLAFVPYVVAGYPDQRTAETIALAAIDARADILEIGLPYSDPLADGVTLQRASTAALRNGSTVDTSLALVQRVTAQRPGVPVVVMGYANQFLGPIGSAAMAQRIADAGASGAIVADLTPDEGSPFEDEMRRRGLAVVYLAAPTSSPERISLVAARSSGFIYCVALTGVTGARRETPTDSAALVARVKAVAQLPVAVGFGVSRPEHVRDVARTGADGVIVGSVLVDALGSDGRDVNGFTTTVKALARATARTSAFAAA
jgi:tryptophan synthase alpha chain